jgi:hypothetical protein
MRPLAFFPSTFLLILVTLVACAPYPSPAGRPPGPTYAAEVHIDFFYDALGPYGAWVQLSPHGWVWLPRDVGPYWRPYTDGHWRYTTYGWTWVSDWTWGWAPFHYGRWLHHAHHGWVWIPGRTWGPAWVAWRHGDGWYGWAPLPPGVQWRAGVGLDLHGQDLHGGIRSQDWVFVPERRLLEPRLRSYIAPLERHGELLRNTRDTTRYREEARSVVERGVDVNGLEKALKRPVPKAPVEDVAKPRVERPGERPKAELGAPVKVYRPQVKPDPPRSDPKQVKPQPRKIEPQPRKVEPKPRKIKPPPAKKGKGG